jgi:hypothetical protein
MPEYITYPKPADFVPEPYFPEGHKRAGRVRCQAWSRQRGQQCSSYPKVGKKTCRMHGGSSPGGIASPNWVNGRQSKYLPQRMQESYLASVSDKELLALRHEISVVDARINDLFQRVDIGESGHLWLRSKEVLVQLRKALVSQDSKKVSEAIIELDELIRRGSTDYGAWNEIENTIELRRRLVETERKRLVDMQQMITAEQAAAYLRAITLAVRENVSDPSILNRIQTAFNRISNQHSE